MVSIPVELHSTVREHDIHFHQIHTKCGSRIRLQKWCPVDKEVVPPDEIARGYEITKNSYVTFGDEDLDDLPVPTLHTFTVDAFVELAEVDPMYFDQSYYLEPAALGKKPYALLQRTLEDKGLAAMGKVALRMKESLALIRVAEDRMVMETLFYPDEIKAMEHTGGATKVEDRELKMAESLVDLMTEKFDPSKYKDEYRDALMERIEAKANGQEVREAPEVKETEVIDLFEALKRSVESVKKPPRGMKEAS
jgi:DNA end-binding protein Ku